MLIAAGSMTPNAIADNFQVSRQAVSKHLRILVECELVEQDAKGREIYYQLKHEKIREIDDYVERLRQIIQSRFEDLDDLLEAMKEETK